MKDNFLLKKNQREVFDTLTDEEAGILIKGIFKYLDTNDSGLTGMLKAIFIPIKNDIDKNEEKYQKKCEILKQNRNHAEISMKSDRNQDEISSDNNHISYITNHNTNNHEKEKKDNRGMGEEEKKKKVPKNKFGEYQNVLLTEKEYESLQKAYSNYEELIKFLDEYIEEKGYKSKSHYLAIRRWVVGAVKENNEKQNKQSKSNNPFREIAKEEGLF